MSSNPAFVLTDDDVINSGCHGDDNRPPPRYKQSVDNVYNNVKFNNNINNRPQTKTTTTPTPAWLHDAKRPSVARRYVPDEDDICDAGVERDPMDDAEMDDDDEARMVEDDCCGEARLNCGRFASVLRQEGAELRQNLSKIDIKKTARSCFSMEKLKNFLPILVWAPKYRTAELQGDVIAGLTVGMTLIPQAIAYSGIAGVAPQYGLYSSIFGCFIYVLFGTSKDIALGPTAIQALAVSSYGGAMLPGDPTCAIILGLLSGIVEIGMYLIGFGVFIDWISFPVMKAFTVAASITIGMSQVKKWFGERGVPREFIPQLIYTVKKIPESRLWDFLLGVVCIFFIVLLKKLKEKKWNRKFRELSLGMKILKKTIWFIGTARNIVVLVIASIVAYIFLENGLRPFSLIGRIPPGIPAFTVPDFSAYDPKTNVTYTFSDIMSNIGGGIIAVPFLGLIESMSIAKVYARKFNYKLDYNQELLPYGIANVLGAFVKGYPVCGAFSRTAVNCGSGVKTPAGGIVSGILLLLSLQYLTPLFYYIPDAALAVVIILAIIDPITFHKLWIFWRIKKTDLVPWIVTFILSFIMSCEFGIAIGSAISFILLLYPAFRPSIKIQTIQSPGDDIEQDKIKVVVITLSNGLMFPAVDYVKKKIFLYCTGDKCLTKHVILDFAHVSTVDSTAVQVVRELLEDFNKNGIKAFIVNQQEDVKWTFDRAAPKFYNPAPSVQDAFDIIMGATMEKMKTEKNGSSMPAVLQYLEEITHQIENKDYRNDKIDQWRHQSPATRNNIIATVCREEDMESVNSLKDDPPPLPIGQYRTCSRF